MIAKRTFAEAHIQRRSGRTVVQLRGFAVAGQRCVVCVVVVVIVEVDVDVVDVCAVGFATAVGFGWRVAGSESTVDRTEFTSNRLAVEVEGFCILGFQYNWLGCHKVLGTRIAIFPN